MIINRIHINKFRGFNDTSFNLGEHITLIAGQNGTQKSTLLGILTQTFTIPTKDHIFSDEKPLTGGSFRSSFQDKFRLSPTLDIPGSHEWTLYFNDLKLHSDLDDEGGFTIESIPRKSGHNETIRFWQKGKRDAGSGYIQLPVIYLSLKRLIPIAEAGKVSETNEKLTNNEQKWFSENYNKILLSNDQLESIDYLESTNKNTLGVTTAHYDWHSNSAGQDNLGRILLAIISFQRLKAEHPKEYQGGILAIDEIDATLYPGSQVKLLEALCRLCKKETIQLIATTHSIHLLEKISELKAERGRVKQFNTIYLKKIDGNVEIVESPSFEQIVNNLNVSINKHVPVQKLPIYTEDKECMQFVKAMLGRKFKNLEFLDISLGCKNLIQLGIKKVPSFTYNNSIIVLDGDARQDLKNKRLKNFICLPGELNPESLLANYLDNLSDKNAFWEERIMGYSKQFCFSNYKLQDIISDRVKAKNWYREQLETNAWGQNGTALYKLYLKTIPDELDLFLNAFSKLHKDFFDK
ncbi:AAA family ATPase [Pseudoalteromonas carrageenovora]|uniref:AAA family ATPase n=1 Tax=Pseudoalteromonas carrageenovora TaxID=227 RepID=UPI0026E48F9C|nr:AAA family ATPase [Pseudoalteromonas carrageenovora]MDO6546436.1 AAA family ATPase [Pseudoalteromonas carrageenovora]MDO6830975.1 AAA family ATPase [Pseudoalteromonas carrageenovora]